MNVFSIALRLGVVDECCESFYCDASVECNLRIDSRIIEEVVRSSSE